MAAVSSAHGPLRWSAAADHRSERRRYSLRRLAGRDGQKGGVRPFRGLFLPPGPAARPFRGAVLPFRGIVLPLPRNRSSAPRSGGPAPRNRSTLPRSGLPPGVQEAPQGLLDQQGVAGGVGGEGDADGVPLAPGDGAADVEDLRLPRQPQTEMDLLA